MTITVRYECDECGAVWTASTIDDRQWFDQHTEWCVHVIASLKAGECPDSGLPLTRDGEAGPLSLSCEMCDCFGYDPDDPRVGCDGA